MTRDIGPAPHFSWGLPFIIIKLVGIKPEQVPFIHKAIDHEKWNQTRSFFKSKAREEYHGEPEKCGLISPTILSCVLNDKHGTYTVEIRVPIYLLARGSHATDRLFDDREHRRLLPISVLASIFDAVGIFPDEETPIDPDETHGELKVTDPLPRDTHKP